MIVDTHCHLDDEKFDFDLDEVLKRSAEFGVQKIIIPGADIKDLNKSAKIARIYENVYFACGVHPDYASDYDEDELKRFIADQKCVAVGECGLDYYRFNDKTQDEILQIKLKQKETFVSQIKLAIEYKKPLIVHIRDANEDSFNILKEYASQLSGVVLHCYNASPLHLELMKYGNFYYGIGGVITFKNAKNLVEIIKKIPLENILIETDAPYLTPEPNRGKRNEPAFTKFVVSKIAQIFNIDEKIIEDVTTQNAFRLFNIGERY